VFVSGSHPTRIVGLCKPPDKPPSG
jgi:hypothetical protein